MAAGRDFPRVRRAAPGKRVSLFIHAAGAAAPGQRTPRRRAGARSSRLYVFKNKKPTLLAWPFSIGFIYLSLTSVSQLSP